MLRTNNYTTILLILIVIILIIGVGVAIYYVLDLNWFKKPVNIYSEIPQNTEPKEIIKGYDLSKRTYDIVLYTDDIKVTVYKDGTVGILMLDNELNKSIDVYKELVAKEVKPSLTGIVKAYEITASKTNTAKKYIVLIDSEGNLYKLVNKELKENGKYAFVKIEGIANIVDIKEISNDNTSPLLQGTNVIAIDFESNEILITDYLVKD